jgi:hypothetical protein
MGTAPTHHLTAHNPATQIQMASPGVFGGSAARLLIFSSARIV